MHRNSCGTVHRDGPCCAILTCGRFLEAMFICAAGPNMDVRCVIPVAADRSARTAMQAALTARQRDSHRLVNDYIADP